MTDSQLLIEAIARSIREHHGDCSTDEALLRGDAKATLQALSDLGAVILLAKKAVELKEGDSFVDYDGPDEVKSVHHKDTEVTLSTTEWTHLRFGNLVTVYVQVEAKQ